MTLQLIDMREALRQAMDEEMGHDSRVLIMGEEVAEYEGAYMKYADESPWPDPITLEEDVFAP
jgi:hypothetical protein